jgi:hypothetical protein
MSGIANEINSMSYLLGTISSMYEGYLISNTKLLEKARKTAYAYRRPLSEAIEFNKAMIKGTSFVGEKLFGVGLVLSAIDVVDNNFSLNSISWAVADTYMGYLGTFVPGCQLISGIYFTGRIGYQIYKEIKKP